MQEQLQSAEFLHWIEDSLERHQNVLAVSNQGTVLRFNGDGQQLIIKAAMGRGLLRRFRQRTLQREFQAYQQMEGLSGIPRCYGMVAGHYLVTEFIRGVEFREAQWQDRDVWFARFLKVLQSIHDRGVSHGDLKSKDNIMVTEDEQPCVIDFGTSFIRRPGWHPVNNTFFEHGRRMDINAWVKHKYHGRYEDVAGEDLELLDYSLSERWVRKLSGRPTDHIPR